MIESDVVHALNSLGEPEGSVSVEIGPRFLELFSENLYKSPNKAFEELVANSWDAGATAVYIHIPPETDTAKEPIWVLDNGTSMDFAGLELLWRVTSDHKRRLASPPRPQIGKFGIGKLATYILASEVTYVCKAIDGAIRSVTMNYTRIDGATDEEQPSARSPFFSERLPLEVRRLGETELETFLTALPNGRQAFELISAGVPFSPPASYDEEFGSSPPESLPSSSGTWTLVLLSALKDYGQSLQVGRIRWLLRTALPLNSSLSISLNDEPLESSKIQGKVEKEWVLGLNLEIEQLEVPNRGLIQVTDHAGAAPYIEVEGIDGRITGKMTLYSNKISGGKSEELGASNGFYVNVLGRVINQQNPDFGLENLSHGAWAHFRATLRADGLDTLLSVEREGLRDSIQLDTFRALLRALFNKARLAYDSAEAAAWPRAGDILAGSWSVLPLRSLAEVVSERLGSSVQLPDSIDATGISDVEAVRLEWQQAAQQRPGDLITEVRSKELGPGEPLVKYDLGTRTLLVNESHPYFRERGASQEGRELLQEIALVDFLTEIHLLHIGADLGFLDDGRRYRDEFLRVLAQLQRKTGAQVAEMLMQATSHPDGFEAAAGDALDYLGFDVTRLGGRGEPEGLAKAVLTPGDDGQRRTYSFTYDAKSTQKASGRVSNKEVGAGRLARHRDTFEADHTLVVAPDYELGALQEECKISAVTPMRAQDLARLLMVYAGAGHLEYTAFREVFGLSDPDRVHEWVEKIASTTESKPHLTINQFLGALEEIGFEGPDALSVEVIADRIRRRTGTTRQPTSTEIGAVVSGLSVLVPSIVRFRPPYVFISASASSIRSTLIAQMAKLPQPLRLAIASQEAS